MQNRWLYSNLCGLLFLTIAAVAQATEVNVVGLFNGKAMVSINGGKPRMLSVSDASPEGIKLLRADSDSATMEIDGKQRTLRMGQTVSLASRSGDSGNPTTQLTADSRGHFITTGTINGVSTRMMVDTGATMVSMSSAEARRIGLSYLNGQRVPVSTANGVVAAYRVTLNTVKVGNITLNQVHGLVQESNMSDVLLGMSFLNRLEMRRDNGTMTLVKKN